MNPISKKLHDKFFTDPDWKHVEDIILKYIEPLRDILLVDTSKDSEDVKAQVIARQTSYKNLTKFLSDAKVVTKKLEDNNPNPFR